MGRKVLSVLPPKLPQIPLRPLCRRDIGRHPPALRRTLRKWRSPHRLPAYTCRRLSARLPALIASLNAFCLYSAVYKSIIYPLRRFCKVYFSISSRCTGFLPHKLSGRKPPVRSILLKIPPLPCKKPASPWPRKSGLPPSGKQSPHPAASRQSFCCADAESCHVPPQ